HRSSHRAGDELAGGVHRHRAVQPRLARRLAALLPPASGAPGAGRERARLDRIRAGGGAEAGAVAAVARDAAGLGLYGRPLPDRSDLVDLPVLAAGLLLEALRARPQEFRAAARRRLRDGGYRL